jgi:hypothetical protein
MIIVIETIDNSNEWGINFNGSNPDSKNYFATKDKETAFNLRDKLNYIFAQLNAPQSLLTNQGEVTVDQVINSAGSKCS